ncbi:hypothetical protein GGS23DRAFT_563216 [Durotheca rogersii]|uniref:uncharacterized protein n=1 Tax=Durotheca rogersii TaxID=419775 RepID=UPI00221E727C|nr:uncharacterized protein GGS23DRAFT_563216 [Durotheca rogersii]KAI5864167.1 hypothetical protein GGS23DRAFT_563216 [Durotheca rogersii]
MHFNGARLACYFLFVHSSRHALGGRLASGTYLPTSYLYPPTLGAYLTYSQPAGHNRRPVVRVVKMVNYKNKSRSLHVAMVARRRIPAGRLPCNMAWIEKSMRSLLPKKCVSPLSKGVCNVPGYLVSTHDPAPAGRYLPTAQAPICCTYFVKIFTL